MARGDVDRPAPGVGDARGPPAPGTSSTRWRRVSSATSGSTSTRPLRRAPGREPPAAPPEHDPPVARGAEVVHERARVGDALAARPAQLLQHVRDRLGQDDVRGGDRDAGAQRLEAARGGVDGQHGGAGAHAAAGGLDRHAAGMRVQRAHARALEDRSAGLDHPRAQAQRQPRGLDGGVVAARSARAGSAASRSARARAASFSGVTRLRRRGGDDLVDHARRARAPWRRACSPARVNQASTPCSEHHVADHLDALRGGAADLQRALAAEARDQRRQVRPQRLAEAAVAPARPVAAQLGLEQRRPRRRAHAAARPSTARCSRRR